MKRFLIHAVLLGLPIGIVMGVFYSMIFGEGILLGLGTGAVFGLGMAAAASASHRRIERNPPAVDGEDVLFWSGGNHFRGLESVGGLLVLTDRRLFFKPHRLNIQKEEWSVPLSDLIRMEPRQTVGILPNGMRAVTALGEERFVVEDRTHWFREVELAMSEGPSG